MSSNSKNDEMDYLEELVRIPSQKKRRAEVVHKVFKMWQHVSSQQMRKLLSDRHLFPLPDNRPSSVNFTIRPTPKCVVAIFVGDNAPLIAADEPLSDTNQPTNVVSKKARLWKALQRDINQGKCTKWAIQFPKRVKRTSNGGYLVLSNHNRHEGKKLINAINRNHTPRKKLSWLKPSTN